MMDSTVYPGMALTKDRPIILDAVAVRALLAGTKTQILCVFKLPRMAAGRPFADRGPHLDRVWYSAGSGQYLGGNPNFTGDQPPCAIVRCDDGTSQHVPCPYGFPRDRLWVKETFGRTKGNGIRIVYRADGEEPKEFLTDRRITGMKWTSPILMRREHSRILLQVTAVRVERVQAITEADMAAEGIEHDLAAYAVRWDAINRKSEFAWVANPWTWVVRVEMTEKK